MFRVAKYEGVAADLRNYVHIVRFCTVEVGTRGLVYEVLKQLGLKGSTSNKTA